jgi:hypothetical protein
MFLVLERLNFWSLVFVIYPTFSSIVLDISELVDGKGVSLVKSSSMELFGGGYSLLWCLVFYKGKPSSS